MASGVAAVQQFFEALGLSKPPPLELSQGELVPAYTIPYPGEMVVEVEHSKLGCVQSLGLQVKFSQTPGKVRTGAPIYGEHTRAILSDCGFDDAEIAALEEEGAVIAAAPRGVRPEKVA